jgi:hypothetical protein
MNFTTHLQLVPVLRLLNGIPPLSLRPTWNTEGIQSSFPLDLTFNIEEGGSRFLRNLGVQIPDYTALYLRRPQLEVPDDIQWPVWLLSSIAGHTTGIARNSHVSFYPASTDWLCCCIAAE